MKYHITYLHDISTDEEKSLEVKKAREKYEKRINRFHHIMKDSSILKKCFRMGKYEPLQEWFTTLGYKNVYIYQHKPVSGSDWKRTEWDWESWFNSNPNFVIFKNLLERKAYFVGFKNLLESKAQFWDLQESHKKSLFCRLQESHGKQSSILESSRIP